MSWISAIRPKTLPLAASSIIAGCAIAMGEHTYYGFDKSLKIGGFILLTALLLQILSNLANDYGDFKKGTDNKDRVGPERALQSGAITPKKMLNAIIFTSVITLTCGIYLLYLSFGKDLLNIKVIGFFLLGITAIIAAIKYTVGKNPYGYKAMGDIFVFIFFGFVGVLGSYYLITHQWSWSVVLIAISFGSFSTMVLNLNNIRDIDNDKASGKITIPVKLGFQSAKGYHTILFFLGWCAMTFFLLQRDTQVFALVFLPSYIFYRNVKFVTACKDKKTLNPELKKVALATFGTALMICLAVWLEIHYVLR